jgi:hypothetical protein
MMGCGMLGITKGRDEEVKALLDSYDILGAWFISLPNKDERNGVTRKVCLR